MQQIGTLAKKSPNDGLNKFKLKFVNTSLGQANVLLGNEYKPFDEFLTNLTRMTYLAIVMLQ